MSGQIFADEDAGLGGGERKVRKKREKKLVVWDKSMIYMTDEQRKNFEKDNPGYKLPFEFRHPHFLIWFTVLSVLFAVAAAINRLIMLIPR